MDAPPRFHPSVLQPDPSGRRPLLDILEAALAAVDPGQAVRRLLRRSGNTLAIGEQSLDLVAYRHIWVVGAGKAGGPMAAAVEEILGERLNGGLVVVKEGHRSPTRRIEIIEAAHPIPNAAGVEAGRRILRLVEAAGADDLVIALLSGGGSALLEAPAPGLTLADLQTMTDRLLACGATINEINCLRKHCSALKGGRLAQAAAPAALVTLVLSDVVGSPLDVIASGPTVPDPTTWADAWRVAERYALVGAGHGEDSQQAPCLGGTDNDENLSAPLRLMRLRSTQRRGEDAEFAEKSQIDQLSSLSSSLRPLRILRASAVNCFRVTYSWLFSYQRRKGEMEGTERTVHLPAPIVERLRRGLAGELADTPKAGDPVFIRSRTIVIGDNRAAAEAACERARTLGCNALLLSTFVEGEAREIAKIAAALGKEVLASGHPLPPPACLVLGGETTVTLRGAGDAGSEPGRGGRNGELALAAALALDGTAGITVASLATDGSDGPTDSAGGLVDGTTAERARRLGYDPADALRRHDSYPLLAAVDDLLVSGPTQTNVNDLIVVLVRSNVEAFSEPRATKGIESCPS